MATRRTARRNRPSKHQAIQPASKSRTISMALYGMPGVGKTRFMGTTPGNVLVLRPPTEHLDSMQPKDLARVEEWVVPDWPSMLEVQEYLRNEGGAGYDWVWLDNISLWQDHGLDDIWQGVLDRKPDRAQYGLDKGEYGVNMHRLGQWVRHMVGNPDFNFGLTAHPSTVDLMDHDTGEVMEIAMPYVQGRNMAPKICGYMNIVAYYQLVRREDNPDRRVLRTAATSSYYAKDQFDAFQQNRLVDPTMPKVLKAIEQSRTTTKRTARRRR